MASIVGIVLAAISGLLLLAAITLFAQTVAFSLLTARTAALRRGRSRIGVLIPAHDEALGIQSTIANIKAQMRAEDRILVVADNCSDRTAAIALDAGAEVVERSDLSRIGKGYALDFGLTHLQSTGACDIVIVVDADCRLDDGAFDALAACCEAEGRPVQGLYLMDRPPSAAFDARFGAFAWLLRNHVRPSGYDRLGLPCQLMGTGMALPASLAQSLGLATGHLTEDLLLGVQSALAGKPPKFCASAVVRSAFPAEADARKRQKARWVHGHLSVIVGGVPALLGRGLLSRRADLLGMALDLLIPPLSLFGAMLIALVAVSGLWLLLMHSLVPLALSFSALCLFGLSLLIGWAQCGRDLIAARDLRILPAYAASVVGIAIGYMAGKRSAWIRSDRS